MSLDIFVLIFVFIGRTFMTEQVSYTLRGLDCVFQRTADIEFNQNNESCCIFIEDDKLKFHEIILSDSGKIKFRQVYEFNLSENIIIQKDTKGMNSSRLSETLKGVCVKCVENNHSPYSTSRDINTTNGFEHSLYSTAKDIDFTKEFEHVLQTVNILFSKQKIETLLKKIDKMCRKNINCFGFIEHRVSFYNNLVILMKRFIWLYFAHSKKNTNKLFLASDYYFQLANKAADKNLRYFFISPCYRIDAYRLISIAKNDKKVSIYHAVFVLKSSGLEYSQPFSSFDIQVKKKLDEYLQSLEGNKKPKVWETSEEYKKLKAWIEYILFSYSTVYNGVSFINHFFASEKSKENKLYEPVTAKWVCLKAQQKNLLNFLEFNVGITAVIEKAENFYFDEEARKNSSEWEDLLFYIYITTILDSESYLFLLEMLIRKENSDIKSIWNTLGLKAYIDNILMYKANQSAMQEFINLNNKLRATIYCKTPSNIILEQARKLMKYYIEFKTFEEKINIKFLKAVGVLCDFLDRNYCCPLCFLKKRFYNLNNFMKNFPSN